MNRRGFWLLICQKSDLHAVWMIFDLDEVFACLLRITLCLSRLNQDSPQLVPSWSKVLNYEEWKLVFNLSQLRSATNHEHFTQTCYHQNNYTTALPPSLFFANTTPFRVLFWVLAAITTPQPVTVTSHSYWSWIWPMSPIHNFSPTQTHLIQEIVNSVLSHLYFILFYPAK